MQSQFAVVTDVGVVVLGIDSFREALQCGSEECQDEFMVFETGGEIPAGAMRAVGSIRSKHNPHVTEIDESECSPTPS